MRIDTQGQPFPTPTITAMASERDSQPNARPSVTADLLEFLDSVGGTPDAYTQMLRLVPLSTTSAQTFANWLEPQTAGEHWSFITIRGEASGLRALACPTRSVGLETMFLFPFIEVHSVLVAWWLTAAWRTRQLTEAATALSEHAQTVAAASCVRALVETAAQLWVDARKLADAWREIKLEGTPITDGDAYRRRTQLMAVLNEVLLGSKFDEKVPGLKATYGRVQRKNVLGSIEKLAKVVGPQFQEDYQWLCNTVHPSLGNYLAFSSPMMRHDTGTHILTSFHGWPLSIERGEEKYSERSIQEAVGRAHEQSALVLRDVLDAGLQLVDDVGLTTQAPKMSMMSYWRDLVVDDTQQLCPCRSGKRGYRCRHVWGDAAVEIPMTFSIIR